MLIRKQFKAESSHIVRDCTSERCSHSIHGHSTIIEVFFTSKGVDNGQMVMDFGLMKNTIGDFIDSFDHSHIMWIKEHESDRNFFKSHNRRWIELPVSPSAEMLSLMFFYIVDKIVKNTEFSNGEKEVELYSVRYHETTTGYAESFRDDLEYWSWNLEDIKISDAIKSEWRDTEMYEKLVKEVKFINPKIKLEYE